MPETHIWQDDAICHGLHDIFDRALRTTAGKLCEGCPVARTCLRTALQEEWELSRALFATTRGGLGTKQRYLLIEAVRTGTSVPDFAPDWAIEVARDLHHTQIGREQGFSQACA